MKSDTIIGENPNGVIGTHVGKISKFLVAGLGQNQTSAWVNQVTIALFAQVPDMQQKTMKFDNDKKFNGHVELSKTLGLSCCFVNLYNS